MLRKKQSKQSFLTRTIVFFTFGIILILISLSWNFYQSRILSFSTNSSSVLTPYFNNLERDEGKLPTRILIEKLNIDLPVVETNILKGVWQINPSGGSHLSSSARVGESGNIIIYGHNKPHLFTRVISLKVGDSIKLLTQDEKEYFYRIYKVETVNPTDISVLAPTTSEVLTFYTCTGLLDSKRFVIKASPDILP